MAKLFAKRIKMVMPTIIEETQFSFIEGRHLLQSALITNEVIEEARRSHTPCLIFKVDYEKAYDSISWEFLMYMLRRIGFSPKWVKWIEGCINLPQFQFCGSFNWVDEESNDRKFVYKGFLVGSNNVSISLLQYADDTILVVEASMDNVRTLKAILRAFELVLGLKINFAKSCFRAFGVSDQWKQDAAKYLNCSLLTLPFVYLGIPIGANPRVPKSVVDKLLRLQRRFLWGGGLDHNKIAWIK
ncbi:uncharacterized protein [Glycine max]|uniref:uncharacterized protein n=1 Tax=Glycine max TaxID=3847 RepID=UPI0003DEB77E|nr:uncharacterized protein LOC121173452 [Glycine max]